MKNLLSFYTIGIKDENQNKNATILQGVINEKLSLTLDIEPLDENKRQLVPTDAYSLSLAPAQYGWRANGKHIEIANGAFIEFEAVAREFVAQDTICDKLVTSPERHFEPKEHTVASLDATSDYMIKQVLATENTDVSTIKGTVYYVSEKSGNDSNSGLTQDDAWQTTKAVINAQLKEGDAVLFERGGLYRTGTVDMVSGVTYGSYGVGEKPIICGSRKNYAKGDCWELFDAENHIWKLKDIVVDPGIILYDAHTRAVSCYGEITGERVIDTEDQSGYEALKKAGDLTFYWGTPETTLENFNHWSSDYPTFIKSYRNPNTDFSDIEIGGDFKMFKVGVCHDVTIDNLCFKFCGGHSIQAHDGVKNLTVTNCVFAWGGGSLLWKTTRYGNAIEVFGGCDGYVTKNNWIYEFYDTAITFQYHFKQGSPYMNNILICDNIIERCYWSLEWWLAPDVKGLYCSSKNIMIRDNFIKYAFKSWGTVQHGLHTDDFGRVCSWGAGIVYGSLGVDAENIVIRNNILDRSFIDGYDHVMTRLFNCNGSGSAALTEWKDNTFIQYADQFFGRVSSPDGAKFYTTSREEVDTALSKLPLMSGEKVCIIKRDL